MLRRFRMRNVPAPEVKHRIILQHARLHGLRTLVETGTFQGDTVAACLDAFDDIYSIELSHDLFEQVAERFAGVPRVHLFEGDSGIVLPQLLETTVDGPALFWLDGHFCFGESAGGAADPPVGKELAAVLRHPVHGHVVLIDDARFFGHRKGYPSLAQIRSLVAAARPASDVTVADDIIRIVLR